MDKFCDETLYSSITINTFIHATKDYMVFLKYLFKYPRNFNMPENQLVNIY